MGLWPILFCELVISCMQNPDMPRGLCCLPINIPSRWYPLVLIALFTIFFGLQFSLLTGLGAGYMYAMGYLRPLEISQATINNWEKRWPFSRMSQNTSFQGTQSNLANNQERSPGFFTNYANGGASSNTMLAGGPAPP